MTKPEMLSIDVLRLDGDTQSRVEACQNTVDEYAALIEASKGKWPFGPLTVYYDGSHYWVADGFHRTLASYKADRDSIPCDVKKGTARDARFFGMRANDQHGLRMSFEDRRCNVVWMLENYPDMTQPNIAENAGVSLRTVERAAQDLKKTSNPPQAGSKKASGKVTQPSAKGKGLTAAEKEANARAKADERERAKLEREAQKLKDKEEKAAQRLKDKEAKKAAALAELPRNEQAKLNRSVAQQHIDKAVRAVDDLNRVKASPPLTAKEREAIKQLVIDLMGGTRRIALVKLLQHIGGLLW